MSIEEIARKRLTEISARADAATEGPWETLPQFGDYELVGSDRSTVCRLDSTTETVEFIAAARSDVPRLVAALTAVLDKADEIELFGMCSASDYDKGGQRAAQAVKRAVAYALEER